VRASPVCKPAKIFFTIFSTPPIKLKLGLQILLYLGWLSTDQLIFGIAKFFGKICAYHAKNLSEALKHNSFSKQYNVKLYSYYYHC
jgi:hypothetical protein